MTSRPQVISTLPTLCRTVQRFRAAGESVALVPTMGALHEGHLALVRLARRRAKRVIVSIFVNPAQFGPGEDLARYPRRLEEDLALCGSQGVDLVFSPEPAALYPPGFAQMYPKGFAVEVVPQGPAIVGLEDAFRPHFFAGVATVVAKLMLQCLPDVAVFGEKDFQQLRVVAHMARDLDIPVKIVGAPTVREPDGLAMSSRNVNLTAEQRAVAPLLHRVLRLCADKVAAGRSIAAVLAEGREALERAGFRLDYLEARDALTLSPVGNANDRSIRLLVAATLGTTRLIDNVAVRGSTRTR